MSELPFDMLEVIPMQAIHSGHISTAARLSQTCKHMRSVLPRLKLIEAVGGVLDAGDGAIYWYNASGRKHRDNDLPAAILADGERQWFSGGKLSRGDDKPAVIAADGTRKWYRKGQLHRPRHAGPAIVYADERCDAYYWNGCRDGEIDLSDDSDGCCSVQ